MLIAIDAYTLRVPTSFLLSSAKTGGYYSLEADE
jgi:hypothetical protein